MNQRLGDSPGDDVRVGRILNEIMDRQARGESVDETTVLREYPEFAEELREHLRLVADLQRPDTVEALIRLERISRSNDETYPAELGTYRIEKVIGQGGMGIVFRAREPALDRTVALKLLRPELAAEPAAVQRFIREAKAAARLSHANVVAIHAVGDCHGTHFIAMEYVDGPSLAKLLRSQGPLDAETCRLLFRQILAGLEAAHAAGLIHRDIKPSNILLSEARPPDRTPDARGTNATALTAKVADFGLARTLTAETRMTLAGAVFGTPEYMSPEQAQGDSDIDQRADLYSAGVVLFQMLTGRTPFRAETGSALIHQILHHYPPNPKLLCPTADGHLCRLALRLMAKRPEDRFPSAAETLARLDGRRRIHVPASASARRGRKTMVAILLAGAAALGAWLGTRASFAPPDTARPAVLTAVKIEMAEGAQTGTILVRRGARLDWTPFHVLERGVTATNAVIVMPGPGLDPVVLACVDPPVDGQLLLALDVAGRRLWGVPVGSKVQWPDCEAPRDFQCAALEAGELDDVPGDEVMLSAHDSVEYATCIMVLDVRTRSMRARYWHFGHVSTLLPSPDFLGPGRPAIIAGGHNNKLDGFRETRPGDDLPVAKFDYVPIVMVLDFKSMSGERLLAVPHPNGRVSGIPLVLPDAYAFLDAASGESVAYVGADAPSRRLPTQDERIGLSALRLARHMREGAWRSCIRADMNIVADPTGTVLLELDSHLNILGCTPNVGALIGRTRDYWEQRFHVIMRNGASVPPYPARLLESLQMP